jgi:hypothetical protein
MNDEKELTYIEGSRGADLLGMERADLHVGVERS